MTPVNLPYLWLVTRQRGAWQRTYAYYRRDGRRVPICDHDGKGIFPGDAMFLDAYNRIHRSFEKPGAKPGGGTIAEVVTAYLGSPEFLAVASATRADYRTHLDDLRTRVGKFPFSKLSRAMIRKHRDSLASTPSKANRFVSVARLLWAWAKDADRWKLDGENPAGGIKKMRTGPGFRPWTLDEVARFKMLASPQMRLALTLAVCTGLRRGDAVALRRGAYRGGIIEVVTSKRGVPLCIPAHRELAAELDTVAHDATTVLVNPEGRPWRADAFSKAFGAAVALVGLPADCHYHGLRKTAGVYLAEAGCSAHEIQAVLACSLENAEYYCRQADRLKLATSAVAKMERRKE